MILEIIKDELLDSFRKAIKTSPLQTLAKNQDPNLPVDYFTFYHSVSSVYSSKIEGENIDFDSFYKHKFLNVTYNTDYTQRSNDLFTAYEFIVKNRLTFPHLQKAHCLLSAHLLPENQQGKIRNNPMFVINSDDKIEYIAAAPLLVATELEKLFNDIQLLLNAELDEFECFYFASWVHLVFVKIHPFQDGNGRSARLLEKWFLMEKFGEKAVSIPLEKNYFMHINDYYLNIKKIGNDYQTLNYAKSLDFLLMTVLGLK